LRDTKATQALDHGLVDYALYGSTCARWAPTLLPHSDRHNEIEMNLLDQGSLTYLLGGQKVTIPGRTAKRMGHIAAGAPQSRPRKPVEVWRRDVFGPLEPGVHVALVVRENYEDVGFVRGTNETGGAGSCQQQGDEDWEWMFHSARVACNLRCATFHNHQSFQCASITFWMWGYFASVSCNSSRV